MSLLQPHNALMWRYKHRTRLDTERKGDLYAESHSVLKVFWKCGRMCIGLMVLGRLTHTHTHTAGSAMSEPRASGVQMATEWMHLHFVGTDHIQIDMIQPPDTKCVPKSKHLSPLRKKNWLYERWKKSIKIFIYKKCDKLIAGSAIQQWHHCHQRHT